MGVGVGASPRTRPPNWGASNARAPATAASKPSQASSATAPSGACKASGGGVADEVWCPAVCPAAWPAATAVALAAAGPWRSSAANRPG